jgi:pyruvate dehydrogenase E2 component (dihydrolipoamide acetyltransferase)
MTEGNLVKWHKAEGDTIKAGQILAEIETDKATMEIEAVDEGILGKIIIKDGTESVQVNALIGLILEEGEDATSLANVNTATPALQMPENSTTIEAHVQSVAAPIVQNTQNERIFASPLARRIANNEGIDLTKIEGTGPRGRIIKADVEHQLTFPKQFASAKSQADQTVSGFEDVPLNMMRKTIAKRLTEAKQTIPHFYLLVDCILDPLLKLRSQINSIPNKNLKLSVNDFLIRACALALKDVPEANATFHDTFVRRYHSADIAVAVAIDGGLITPIIRNADAKSLQELSSEMRSLAERAKAGKLKPEEYQGGGFSLSNLGMFGVKSFSAIVNPPQASILAVGAGEKRAVVQNDTISIATVMSCTLSADHRVVDGATGAKFLASLKYNIENPLNLVI